MSARTPRMPDTPQTLPQWLVHNGRERASLVGHRHKRDGIWQQFSWADIAQRVAGIAAGLIALGVARDQTVMLISENRPELYWAQWAATAAFPPRRASPSSSK